MYKSGMYSGYEVETNKESFTETKTNKESYMEAEMPMGMPACGTASVMPGMVCSPVYECPQERVIHREIMHEVPHVCPINTRIVNHHIYRHTYSPCYTCCEENEICNINQGCCNNF